VGYVDIVGYARRFLVTVCIVILLVSNTVISSVLSDAKHGCAPATPSPMTGTLAQPEATAHVIFLNEVLSNPGSVWNCSEQGTSSSSNNAWVELYNSQNQPFDLYAVHSSFDAGPNTTPFYFPVGTAIAAHGFLVIFPPLSIFAQSSSTPSSSLLRLLINGTLVDQVTLAPLVSDTSYARKPDGGDTWQVTDAPTIDASNVPSLPTPMPTSTPTSTPTRTPKLSSVKTDSQKSGTQSKISTLDGATISASKQTAGTQPAWNTLSVPTTISPVPETTTQGNISNSAPQATDTADLPQKVLLTSLAAASLLALLWISRFFGRFKKLSETSTEVFPILGNDEFSAETVSMPIVPDDSPPIERK
jgi:hypothetical protein